MSARVRALLVALLALSFGVVCMAVHASGTSSEPSADAVIAARATGLTELSLSSASRWLRHPSMVEPGAPFADAPGALDVDPAGALIGPPRAQLERFEGAP